MEGDGWRVEDFSQSKKKKKKGASGNVFILRQENNLQKIQKQKAVAATYGSRLPAEFPPPR